jgi:hypothetical protein
MSEQNARKKFQVGDRVRFSALGLERFGHRRGTGVVVGFGQRSIFRVRVKRDGVKTVSGWHADFWEKDKTR